MIKSSRKASSLVYVLVTIAAVSAVILAGSATLISSARQRNAIDSGLIAEQMARSAAQEGLLRLSLASKDGNLTKGDYGTLVNTPYSLTAATHGFATGTSCGTLASDTGTVDTDCARYKIAVRQNIGITNGSFTYSTREFPTGTARVLNIASNASQITFQPTVGTSMSYILCNPNCTGSPITAPQVSVPAGAATAIQITLTYTNPASHGTIMTVTSVGQAVIDKGFTSIEATGIAPDGTQRTFLATVRTNDSLKPGDPLIPTNRFFGPTSSSFSSLGICQPDPTGCKQ